MRGRNGPSRGAPCSRRLVEEPLLMRRRLFAERVWRSETEVTKMITAREVAEKVGISISTVGRAMADDPRISAETKAKVRRVADELGYVGNLPARMMRGSSSNLIG